MKYTYPVHVKLDKLTIGMLNRRAAKERRKPGQMARILIEDGLRKK